MVLGRDCCTHRGCFGVWPDEPCPYHDDEPSEQRSSRSLLLLDWSENSDVMHVKETMMEDKTYINRDVRVFESDTWAIKIASRLELKKAVYLDKTRVGATFLARTSFIMGENSHYVSPVYLSSPDSFFRDCTFAAPVLINSEYPAKSYRFYGCSFASGDPKHVSFLQSRFVWWEDK